MNGAGPDHVLVVYAHPNPESFTHAVLDQIVRGLADAGHSYEVLDLYAIGFNPVFSLHDSTQFIHHTFPMEPSTEPRSSACSSTEQGTRSNGSWPSDG
jgi:putative NADPH-quinone reductase